VREITAADIYACWLHLIAVNDVGGQIIGVTLILSFPRRRESSRSGCSETGSRGTMKLDARLRGNDIAVALSAFSARPLPSFARLRREVASQVCELWKSCENSLVLIRFEQ
jgi:hypothetical protein